MSEFRCVQIAASCILTEKCGRFVCATLDQAGTTERLRNYRSLDGITTEPTILQAAMATSAAPTYFSGVPIQGMKFVDGALGANNPAFEVEGEATDLWCPESALIRSLVKCFISIGTGHLGIRSISDKGAKNFAQSLQKQATETEKTNQTFMKQWRSQVEQWRCFRFNVSHGLDKVTIAEYTQQSLISAAAAAYLQEITTQASVRFCVKNLRAKQCMYHHFPTTAAVKKSAKSR